MTYLDVDALNQCVDFTDPKEPRPVLNAIFVVDLPDNKRLYAATTGQIATAIVKMRADDLPGGCVRIVNYKKMQKKEVGTHITLDAVQLGQDYDAAQEWEKMRGILPKNYGGLCKTEYERATCYKVFNPDFTKKVLKYAGLNAYTAAGKVYLGDADDILAPQIWENGDMFIEIMPMRQF